MKVQPKVPGATPTPGADGAGSVGDSTPAKGFSEAVRPAGDAAGPPGAARVEVPSAIGRIVEQFAAGEISRAEAATRAAAAAVESWPPGTLDGAARAGAIEEIAGILSEDPTFTALLDAAAGGPK